MEEDRGLIVFEKAMNKRFIEMAHIHGLKVFTADLQNNFSGNLVANISKRLVSQKQLLNALEGIISFIDQHKIKVVYFSTTEGYVSHNIIHRLKNHQPDLTYIGLQHGVFPLKYDKGKECARKTINTLGRFLFGVFPIGAGFGGIQLHAYFVYSQRERDFLVRYRNWEESRVEVRLDFVKAELFQQYKNSHLQQDPDKALFLMQCLHMAGLCTKEEELRLLRATINYLAKKYSKVLIKGHPACEDQMGNWKPPHNVLLVDDMVQGFIKCKHAYSFFSTALIDAKIFNLRTTGIIVPHLQIDEEIYNNFDLKIKFEDILSF